LALAVCLGALAPATAGQAATIGYWRMEVDDDPSAGGLSVPNELAFGTPLVSAEAALDGSNLPTTLVPLSSDPNAFSVGATAQGGANGINASAAWYAELAVTSISIEFWARTQESVATPFRWTTGGADGVVLTDPNSLDLTWYVDVGGTPTAFQMTNLDDMDTSWSHYAFTYSEFSGIARFYVDGVLVQSVDGPDGAPLLLVPGTPIELGVLMDFASAGQGTIDEVRIDGSVLSPGGLLVPEPSTKLLLLAGLALALRRGVGRRH
jgi:hypothetical protein